MDRKTWLASLKVGDEVAVIRGNPDKPEIRTLSLINDRLFAWEADRRGEQISSVRANGRISNVYGKASIEPITDAIRQKIADCHALDRLRYLKWSQVPVEVRRQVVTLLDAAGKPTP